MVYSFLCFCPLRLAIMLNFNISKGGLLSYSVCFFGLINEAVAHLSFQYTVEACDKQQQ